MAAISIIAMILYGANKYYHFAPYLTFHGFVRCICFFFMGHLIRETGWLKETNLKKDLITGLSALALSLVIFYWHINEDQIVIHITLYFVVNFISVIAIISLFHCINRIRLKFIMYISIGTMAIFGLHRMIIGIIDFGVEKTSHITDITYNWYECIIVALIIEVILLPVIIWANHSYPILLGKRHGQIIGKK